MARAGVSGGTDPFGPYHRARAAAAAGRAVVLSVLAAGLVGAMMAPAVASGGVPAVAAAPERVAGAEASPGDAEAEAPPSGDPGAGEPGAGESAAGNGAGDTLPAPDPADGLAQHPAPPETTAPPENGTPPADGTPRTSPSVTDGTVEPRRIRIDIDALGYQAEIDQCLWVRMDFQAVNVPIVGAHNYCGGDVLLDLQPGDIVVLTAHGLDGEYVVTGDREVRTGEYVSVATAGLTGDVILQTCYWDTGTTRLVTAQLRKGGGR
ncbi:hypothetical protein GCM10010921_28270 [Microbacterium album]|uniref:Sortase n=2 Tax=Microbacterium album TaxID=2053191 RepID=A0A917IHN1_9MICO|nr:hypothetical protein GCM10010921_28270 [Microbacterium album]